MLFLEGYARPLLIVHAVCAAVLVGAATHHLLWSRGYWRRRFGRAAAERRFVLILAGAYLLTFVVGNLLYPTYKVRVRAEYFDNPPAISEEARLREGQRVELGIKPQAPSFSGSSLSSIAHLFDIKEHWVALGCAASLLLLLLSRLAHPKDHPSVLPLYLGLSALACGSAWMGALIGLLTASYRSVGGVQ